MLSVLVTGVGGPAGFSAVKSLKLAKKKLKIIGTDIDYLAVGRFEVDKFYVVPPADSPDYIDAVLKVSKENDVKVIIPTVDEEIYILSKSLAEFKKSNIIVPIPEYEVIRVAQDKSLTVSTLSRLGIPTPTTFAPRTKEEFFAAIDSLGFPCVKKLKTGRGGRGFEIIKTADDAREIAAKENFDLILLQEFLDGELYLNQLLGDGSGRCLTSIIHRRLKTKDKGSGTAISAVTVRNPAVKKYGELLVKELKWYGVVSPEFMISSKYGESRPLLIEINPRIAGQSFLSTCAGINLAYYLVHLPTGQIENENVQRKYELNKTYVRLWHDAVFGRRELASYPVHK